MNTTVAQFEYSKPFPDKAFGVVINGACEALQLEVAVIMADNWMSSKNYQTKKESGAFFQGGHSGGDWIFLELWAHKSNHRGFVEHMRDVFVRYHPEGKVSGLERLPEVLDPDSIGPHRPQQHSGPPIMLVVVFRKLPWQDEVISSIHEIPQEVARSDEALKEYGVRIANKVRDEFVARFHEFRQATWRHEIRVLTPADW